jgi:hypothetical protein
MLGSISSEAAVTSVQLIAPFFGAILLEVVHWYGLRDKLHLSKYRKALHSLKYWIITLLMVGLGPVGALIVYENATPAGLLIAGAAFPSVFKKIVGTFVEKAAKLGPADEHEAPSTMDYFSA